MRQSSASRMQQDERKQRGDVTPQPYQVKVSAGFLAASLVASMVLAFCAGRAARFALLSQQTPVPQKPPLPQIIAKNGKKIPHTRYLSKNFDTARSACSSSWLVIDREPSDEKLPTCSIDDNETDDSIKGAEDVVECNEEQQEKQPPAAEHLMVDIKNVNAAFLNSEARLAQAMIQVIEEAELTLLSYHCHGLAPMGVSCVGVLLQNYVSFHTWPTEGVITLDLCVGGTTSILPVLPIIERQFGVPRHGEEPPEMRWAHKLRGFPPDKKSLLFSSTDLGWYVLGDLASGIKTEVISVETDFQWISIYDTLFDVTDDAPGAYESGHPELFLPNRVLMLDGWLQSTRLDEAAYHEAFVHPSMFAHAHPKRVAIVGGGEGAALREVLKHKGVEEAIMFEIDQQLVNVTRKHLPEWSDCSDLVGSDGWCAEDPRATIRYEDAFAWFLNRYSDDEKSPDAPIDVIIMNTLDPESAIPYADKLYRGDSYMRAFYNALSDDGILVMQLGEAPEVRYPDETHSKFKNRAAAIRLLEEVGFESIHAYEESHCGFHAPWMFVVAFKSYSTRTAWYRNEAEIAVAIHERAVRTKSGTDPFRYFDGSTMVSYQVPSRAMETAFCRRVPRPDECSGHLHFKSDLDNVPISAVEVKRSGLGKKSGRGVFAKADIPKDVYIAPEKSVESVNFMPSTIGLILGLNDQDIGDELEALVFYMFGYGFSSRRYGAEEVFVDSSIITFVNHGCHGSYNVGMETEVDEFTADLHFVPEELNGKSHAGTSTFNPVVDRTLRFPGDISRREINAADEILENYLDFIGSDDDWETDLLDLRDLCSGGEGGKITVTGYEHLYQAD